MALSMEPSCRPDDYEGCDGSMLGGLDDADADAGRDEPGREPEDSLRSDGEERVGESERGDAVDEGPWCPGAVAQVAGGEAHERRCCR